MTVLKYDKNNNPFWIEVDEKKLDGSEIKVTFEGVDRYIAPEDEAVFFVLFPN